MVITTIGGVAARATEVWTEIAFTHGRWMVWNALLATVPLVLAVLLFAQPIRRTLAWWLGVIAFVLFLPNAPYVLSDVVHLVNDVRATPGPNSMQFVFGFVPIYAAFFAYGIVSYALSLRLVRNAVIQTHGPTTARVCIAALHLASATGVLLGRVWRFNSWAVVTHPATLAETVGQLLSRWPLATIAATSIVLFVAAAFVDLAIDGINFRRQQRATI
jgi:uncharacterized membrane protein